MVRAVWAVPALISNDVIEFWVDRPIEDPAVAAKLAMEMFWLCPDGVDQGTESVEELAKACALIVVMNWGPDSGQSYDKRSVEGS
ncbi:MAG: DUF4253 domain-containing protein [Armatimonadetes bacterium]|nr:DUF4253 domain-containing protein [Armatimonadota bacterium]